MTDSQPVIIQMLDARLAALNADTQVALLRLENKMDRTRESLTTEITLARAHAKVDLEMWMVLLIGWLASATGWFVVLALTHHH